MRTREDLRLVMRLAAEGVGHREIAHGSGVPPTTVRRWIAGGAPRFDDPAADTCPACGHGAHLAIDGAAYSYLLGLYLGDGHLATFPRTMCLRVYLDARYPRIVAECADARRSDDLDRPA